MEVGRGICYDGMSVMWLIFREDGKICRVWSHCKILQEDYMTVLVRPGSCLATLVSQEMQDHMFIGTFSTFGPVKSS